MRLLTGIIVIGFTLVGLSALLAEPRSAAVPTQNNVTLLGTLAEWKYPGSMMPHGASISDGGNPQAPSVKCQAVLTTPDPIDRVIEFYAKKFGITVDGDLPNSGGDVEDADAISVSLQDDSQGRPIALKVLVINKADTSTTLVISRAEGEKETHIAWSHYLRFEGKR